MNIQTASKTVRIVILVAATFVAVLAVSWVAGQCRDWRQPKAPKAIPAHVDAGAPVAGPVSEAPTVPACIEAAVPDLSREDVLALAKKYGIEVAPKRQQPSVSADVSPQPPSDAQHFKLDLPRILAEESFSGPAGDTVDVSAWQLAEGGRVDLRGSWREYQPPAPPKPPASTCGGDGWLGNEAAWEWTATAGAIATPDGIGPGVGLALAYRGPRTGRATWGARGEIVGGQVGGELDGAAIFGAAVSIK